MTPIIVDSSIWIDFFNGVVSPKTDKLTALLATQEVIMGDLIFAEVMQGFSTDHRFITALTKLNLLPSKELAGFDIALKAALNYRKLRKIGITPRKTIDTIIATFCIENKVALLYSDRDFDPFAEHLGLMAA